MAVDRSNQRQIGEPDGQCRHQIRHEHGCWRDIVFAGIAAGAGTVVHRRHQRRGIDHPVFAHAMPGIERSLGAEVECEARRRDLDDQQHRVAADVIGRQAGRPDEDIGLAVDVIGKVELPQVMPIIGGEDTVHYRNKLEFTFSNKRYLLREEMASQNTEGKAPPPPEGGLSDSADLLKTFEFAESSKAPPLEGFGEAVGALGFHVPRIFDKVIDIEECYLMDDVNNAIRNTIRSFAIENNFSFYDIKEHTGWLRNIIIRYCTTGELLVNICLNYDVENDRKKLFDHLLIAVPSITTLVYTINPKWNDSIYDLTPQVYHGKGFVIEKLEDFQFKISPKSFFQTNTRQAEKLYAVTRDFAGLTGNEVLYDLYCGTGSIGIF